MSTGGGGIINYGSATLINTVVSDNQAGLGAAAAFQRGHARYHRLDAVGQSGGYNGGAIFNYLGTVTLTNSTVSGNFAGISAAAFTTS